MWMMFGQVQRESERQCVGLFKLKLDSSCLPRLPSAMLRHMSNTLGRKFDLNDSGCVRSTIHAGAHGAIGAFKFVTGDKDAASREFRRAMEQRILATWRGPIVSSIADSEEFGFFF